jgi:hypothetical protein
MNIIQKLPDDIVIYIYTKILKKYRLCEGKLIKLIDFEKYKFLEKYVYRKIVRLCELHFGDNNIEYEIKYQLNNFNQISNRKDLLIDDDMICINLTLKENTIKYEINRFKLKKKEELKFNKGKQSIYFKGGYTDYDWEVVSYIYEI